MSSGEDPAAIIADDLSFLVSNYCANAGSALVVYEYMITFGREVELFWKRRLTGAAALFYFNRYLSLVVDVYGLLENMKVSDQSCPAVARSSKALDIIQYFPWAVFSGLRAFALSRNWPLSILIFLLSLVPLGVNFAHFAFHSTGINFFTGCLSSDDVTSDLTIKFTIASRTCLIAADVLLIYITWFNMYRRVGPRHPTVKNRFMTVLLRDGTIYFVVLLILNTLHLTLSLLSVEYSVSNVSYITQFSEPITTILISRFLLNLQSANRRVMHYASPDGASGTFAALSDLGATDTLVFEQRVIGSLGETLDIGLDKGPHLTVQPAREPREPESVTEGEGGWVQGRKPKVDGVEERGEVVEMTPLSSPLSRDGGSAA